MVVPLVVCVVAFALFVMRERRAQNPLMSFGLLRRSHNYLGATISQMLAGMAEMGLGLIFPLLLIHEPADEPRPGRSGADPDHRAPLLRDALDAAEQVGLHPATFDTRVAKYLASARVASDYGYSVTFLVTTVLALIGLIAAAALVRKPVQPSAQTAEYKSSTN